MSRGEDVIVMLCDSVRGGETHQAGGTRDCPVPGSLGLLQPPEREPRDTGVSLATHRRREAVAAHSCAVRPAALPTLSQFCPLLQGLSELGKGRIKDLNLWAHRRPAGRVGWGSIPTLLGFKCGLLTHIPRGKQAWGSPAMHVHC